VIARFAERSRKLVDIELIPRERTSLVGYISGGEVVAEQERCAFLRARLPGAEALPGATWEAYEGAVLAVAGPAERPALQALLANYRKRHPGVSVGQFAEHLAAVAPILEANAALLASVRATAARNQDVYLTGDHMDVYFATSVRKRWGFEDLFDFVNRLMAEPGLVRLNLRHFEPTQAFICGDPPEDKPGGGLGTARPAEHRLLLQTLPPQEQNVHACANDRTMEGV
jgi:hypothetical protein